MVDGIGTGDTLNATGDRHAGYVAIIGALEDAIRAALNELGVPDGTYPAPVTHAVGILLDALDDEDLTAHYLHANPEAEAVRLTLEVERLKRALNDLAEAAEIAAQGGIHGAQDSPASPSLGAMT